MAHTLNRTAKLFTVLATIYIMTLSTVYAVGTINTVNEINEYQTYLHEQHLASKELRKEYLNFSSPEFSAAAKDPYFKSEDYRNILEFYLDIEQYILQGNQDTLATYKRQADHFVFAREAYKNLEESFPQDTAPVMDDEMSLRMFLTRASEKKCDPNAYGPYDTYDPKDPYFMIAKKYNFCSTK